MSRAEIRRQQRADKKGQVSYSFKRTDIDKIKSEVTEKAVDTAFSKLMIISLLTLKDEFGFGEVRLNRYIDKMQTLVSCLHDKHSGATIEDYKQVLFEETGIKIENA